MFVQKSIECHSSNDGGGNFHQKMQGYKRFSFPKELGKLEGVISLPLSTPDHQHERALAPTLDSRRDDGQKHRRYMLMRTPVNRQSTEVSTALLVAAHTPLTRQITIMLASMFRAVTIAAYCLSLASAQNGTSPTSVQATTTSSGSDSLQSPPDVKLNVPTLSVGRIELDVDNLSADINLNANIASLVTINAGVQVSIQEVNLTISDVEAQLDLVVRLGHLVDIVNRVFESLDLNPLLISTISNVTSLVGDVVGAVDGLLGSVTQGGTTLSFVIDNLGNIVQEVGGVSSIVGNYASNMTATGAVQQLSNGLTQKTYSYAPLNSLVNIVFNSAGQIVQATVDKSGSGGSSTTSVAPGTSGTTSVAISSQPTSTTPVSSTTTAAVKKGHRR